MDTKEGEGGGRTPLRVCALNLKSPCLKKIGVGVCPCRVAQLNLKISLNYSEYKNYPLRSKNRAWLEEQEGQYECKSKSEQLLELTNRCFEFSTNVLQK